MKSNSLPDATTLRLKNPTSFIRSASIVKAGNYWVLNADTKHGEKREVSESLHSLKVLFGIHLMAGGKWEKS